MWEDKGPTPLGEKGFTPQGMTWVKGNIIFANTWKDERSRVYEIEPETMKIRRYFDMPEGAVHTSGLAWDGKNLWAVDYLSNYAYCIDLEASLSEGQAVEKGRFATTLKGTSACAYAENDGKKYLVISDFMNTKRTYFVCALEALKAGTAKGFIDFSYHNEGFSQGLEFVDGFLYESENKFGLNVINKMDLNSIRETESARKSTILQYPGPAKGIEDLVWDGTCMWTSDESVFRFFRGTIDSAE